MKGTKWHTRPPTGGRWLQRAFGSTCCRCRQRRSNSFIFRTPSPFDTVSERRTVRASPAPRSSARKKCGTGGLAPGKKRPGFELFVALAPRRDHVVLRVLPGGWFFFFSQRWGQGGEEV